MFIRILEQILIRAEKFLTKYLCTINVLSYFNDNIFVEHMGLNAHIPGTQQTHFLHSFVC